ncbi:MAG: type VII toxin-antitoxin system MntA family adenylyltransferase antitoxin [Pseudobdellovibrionaceae bacterium]
MGININEIDYPVGDVTLVLMEDKTKEIIEILKPHTEFVFLLGSYGTQRFGAESDIDLAAYFKEHVDYGSQLRLSSEISELTNRDVDLVDMRNIDPIFARQVIETGRLLLDNDHKKLVNWQIVQLGKYIDFKMDRAEIEKNLLKRKQND